MTEIGRIVDVSQRRKCKLTDQTIKSPLLQLFVG